MQQRRITNFSTNLNEIYIRGKVRELSELHNGYDEQNNDAALAKKIPLKICIVIRIATQI